MILSACLCLVLLNLGLTSAVVHDSDDKATEINYYVVINFQRRYNDDFPALEKKLEDASRQCELKINTTIDTCLACIKRNQNSGHSPGSVGFDQVILGIIPAPFRTGLDKFGKGLNFAKKIPNFITGTIPKTAENVGKEVGKFVTGTIPNTAKNIGKEFGTFFTGTLPGVTKNVGKELGTFFTGTIPKVGKTIGNGFKSFGNSLKGNYPIIYS
ncbi:uncharacterized protein LOC110444618 [Mizuhopecten yessoensis]|uniref:uncharacterized protein LOC110444618 n=1 Tax=Mizuhopecten yessoensis TaxID=6573 RepID=UPI000B45D687|nr:uncharacterized protein LOC110444618 [Mizuhopecten yessoensis]